MISTLAAVPAHGEMFAIAGFGNSTIRHRADHRDRDPAPVKQPPSSLTIDGLQCLHNPSRCGKPVVRKSRMTFVAGRRRQNYHDRSTVRNRAHSPTDLRYLRAVTPFGSRYKLPSVTPLRADAHTLYWKRFLSAYDYSRPGFGAHVRPSSTTFPDSHADRSDDTGSPLTVMLPPRTNDLPTTPASHQCYNVRGSSISVEITDAMNPREQSLSQHKGTQQRSGCRLVGARPFSTPYTATVGTPYHDSQPDTAVESLTRGNRHISANPSTEWTRLTPLVRRESPLPRVCQFSNSAKAESRTLAPRELRIGA